MIINKQKTTISCSALTLNLSFAQSQSLERCFRINGKLNLKKLIEEEN